MPQITLLYKQVERFAEVLSMRFMNKWRYKDTIPVVMRLCREKGKWVDWTFKHSY